MKNDQLGILDYLLVIFLLGLMIISTSCTKESVSDLFLIPQMSLDGRLPMDSNGYYHLKINTSTQQTIHRIDGMVDDITEPTKVSFTSNLNWIYSATGESVPTVNPSSWATPDDPSISTVIAPIRNNIGDTLVVTATIRDWNISQNLNIVLD